MIPTTRIATLLYTGPLLCLLVLGKSLTFGIAHRGWTACMQSCLWGHAASSPSPSHMVIQPWFPALSWRATLCLLWTSFMALVRTNDADIAPNILFDVGSDLPASQALPAAGLASAFYLSGRCAVMDLSKAWWTCVLYMWMTWMNSGPHYCAFFCFAPKQRPLCPSRCLQNAFLTPFHHTSAHHTACTTTTTSLEDAFAFY